MKQALTKLFSPILNRLEGEEAKFEYKPSQRKFLVVMGLLFLGLSGVTTYFALQIAEWAGLLPIGLFAGIGLLCLMVASLGSDRAVARIWRFER